MPSTHLHQRATQAPLDFERDIQPLLARCVQCHGPGKGAGLRLDGRAAALAELDSGAHAIVPGKPEESELLRRIADASAEGRMPPKGEMLPAAAVAKLRAWIAAGAEWPDHWAYRPLTKSGRRSWAATGRGPASITLFSHA